MNKKIKIIIYFTIGFIFISFLIIAFSNTINNSKVEIKSNKIQVATSFYPIYFFAQQISKDKADVVNITPVGAEPHDYEPTAKDIAKIENSKLIIINGGGLEAWENDIRKNLNYKNNIILTISEGVTDQRALDDGKNINDFHIWLNPILAKEIVNKITDNFIKIDPLNKDYYQLNADFLKTQLDNLDKEYKQGLSNCKEKNIITSHLAFGYLADAYGFHQISITGLSPDTEPSPQKLIDIVKFARDNNVKYIFFESLVSPKLSNTIANELGAKTLILNPIEGLTNEEISMGENYFTKMKNNLINLKIALQCQ